MFKKKKILRKCKKPISAEAIAQMADRGEDITCFFTGGKMMKPVERASSKRLQRKSEPVIRPETMKQLRQSVKRNRKLYELLAK